MSTTQQEIASLVRADFRDTIFSDLLRRPTSVLLGANPAAVDALKLLEVNTVFDLATSEVFASASKISEAGNNTRSLLYQHGSPTADLVREEAVGGAKVDQLRFLKIGALERVPAGQADTVAKALDVDTIRDLALYPPYRAARSILNSVYFPENASGYDTEQPSDLLPKNGEYPTERVQYTTLVMDEIKLSPNQTTVDVQSDTFKPIDVTKLATADPGFQNIAFGALITLGQSWYAQGVTLGHLLHSVSLAPGESTRVAVVDWTRKSKAGQTEVIQEDDRLENETSHNRAMNEVTQAVANDAQSGFSESNQSSSSQAVGVAVSASASYFGLASIDVSANYNQSSTNASADSYSTSSGHRDLASEMTQNVNDRTHQSAHSTRSKRASVVKEVSQSEHEQVSTRVLANYNHMHALTIQYYEVVQIYKTRVSVAKVDKVVFIPIKIVDFQDETTVRRFKNVLIRASPTQAIRDAIQNLDVLELAPVRATNFIHLGGPLGAILANPFLLRGITSSVSLAGASPATATVPPATSPISMSSSVIRPSVVRDLEFKSQLKDILWNRSGQISQLTGILNRAILRDNSESLFPPTDTIIEGVTIDADGATVTPLFQTIGGSRDSVSVDKPLPMINVTSINVRGSDPNKDVDVDVQLTVNRGGTRFPINLPTVKVSKGTTSTTRIVDISPGGVSKNVKDFLTDNKVYYSTAVYRSLDTTQLALLLSGYTIKIKARQQVQGSNPIRFETIDKSVPISQVVEPRPVRYVGNYLAFKMNPNEDDNEWKDWLNLRNLKVGTASEDIVPLPSGGTFAEAVLGRYNCAEKLDITRFWNWQDSPIPILPSDIAAIQTGKHDTSDGISSSGLSNPIINMAAPSALPDPTGTAAILSAIQNGNMFRDQSGLQGTIGLAATGTQQAVAAATSAGQQASTNLANQLQADTERQRIKAQRDVAMAQASRANNSSRGGLNHSQDGAKINYFDKTKNGAGGVSGGASNSSAPVTPATTNQGNSRNGGSVPTTSNSAANQGETSSFSQNPAALAATWGDGQPRSALFRPGSDDSDGGFQLASTRSNQVKDAAKAAPWRDLIEFEVPASIVSDLAKRHMEVQKITDAYGSVVNTDMYMVRIDQNPTVDGTELKGAALLSHVRKNLPDLVDKRNSIFSPFDGNLDKAKWLSDSPVGAVIRIDIAGPDNAAVVCSEADSVHWRFSTVETPFSETGSHPVSGTREWGIKNNIIYVRGADRATKPLEAFFTQLAFLGGDALWRSFQEKLKAFVDSHGGQATILPPFRQDLPWDGGIPFFDFEAVGRANSVPFGPVI